MCGESLVAYRVTFADLYSISASYCVLLLLDLYILPFVLYGFYEIENSII